MAAISGVIGFGAGALARLPAARESRLRVQVSARPHYFFDVTAVAYGMIIGFAVWLGFVTMGAILGA
jgi:hypothetical protein